jgi:hypothetical protein
MMVTVIVPRWAVVAFLAVAYANLAVDIAKWMAS